MTMSDQIVQESPRKLIFKLFKTLPKKLRTVANWKNYRDRMHQLPELPIETARLMEMIYVFHELPTVKAVGLSSRVKTRILAPPSITYYVDCYIGDLVIDSHHSDNYEVNIGTHTIRGVIVSFDHTYAMYVKRHIFSTAEVAAQLFHPHISNFTFDNSRDEDNGRTFLRIGNMKYGLPLLNSSRSICLGTFSGVIWKHRHNLKDSNDYSFNPKHADDRKFQNILLLNTVLDFLSSETSNDTLNGLRNLERVYCDPINRVSLGSTDYLELFRDDYVTIEHVKGYQNNVSYQITNMEIPESFRENEAFHAYLNEGTYYQNYGIRQNADLKYEDMLSYIEGAECLFNNQPIDFVIYEQEQSEPEPRKVFIESILKDNQRHLIQFFHQHQQSISKAKSELDRDRHRVDTDGETGDREEYSGSVALSS